MTESTTDSSLPQCAWTGSSEGTLTPHTFAVSDPLGLKREMVELALSEEGLPRAKKFIDHYNQRARYASGFLVGWFLVENLIFLLLFVGRLPKDTAVVLFSALLGLLGVVYWLLPYVTFDLYRNYTIPTGVRLVRAAASAVILFAVLLYTLFPA